MSEQDEVKKSTEKEKVHGSLISLQLDVMNLSWETQKS